MISVDLAAPSHALHALQLASPKGPRVILGGLFYLRSWGVYFTSRGFLLPPLLGELFVSPLIVFDINRESSPAALGGFILPRGGLFYLRGFFFTSEGFFLPPEGFFYLHGFFSILCSVV